MITTKQRSNLRAMANKLSPNIWIGKSGPSQSVVEEIDLALFHNELIKVSVLKTCDIDTKSIANDVAAKLKAEVIHVIGGKFVLYRLSDKKEIEHIVF